MPLAIKSTLMCVLLLLLLQQMRGIPRMRVCVLSKYKHTPGTDTLPMCVCVCADYGGGVSVRNNNNSWRRRRCR